MRLGPLAPALLAAICLTGCAARAPETRPVPPPAADASEVQAVPAGALETQPAPAEVAVPPPEYPREALDAGFEGSVLLKILIDETGRVREAKVLRDPGRGLGAAAARSALAHFRFKPGRLHDKPVAVWWTFTVTYQLPRR